MTHSIRTFETREAGGALVVTALSAGFGTVLMSASTALAGGISNGVLGESDTVKVALMIVAWIFLGLALFVGGIVTVNTFGTIIAGRAKKLALLRLLGASAQKLRRLSVKEGFTVGILGALIGVVIGAGLTQLVLAFGRIWWGFSEHVYAPWFDTSMIAPTLAAVVVTTISAWIGSSGILRITPIEALGTAQAALEKNETTIKRPFPAAAVVFLILGILLLGLGSVIGLGSPGGVLIAFPGGVLSFIAFMMTADRFLPPILKIGGEYGQSAAAKLAARNTARHPRRTTRSALGVIIGVGLISMFTVFGASYSYSLTAGFGDQEIGQELMLPALIVLLLVGFSVVVASVGLVNSLSLSAIQRRKEISLLRALGLTKKQVKTMGFIENARITFIATLVGLILGIFYGYAGAVSFLGSLMKQAGSFSPVVPWQLLVGSVIGALIVTIAATAASTRKSIKIPAMEVLAEE